ncbi:alpha/beta fold hydrolase [Labrys wisconsinensis]|uniref:Pimeloyl-ACP methyl ester carboxylesterase n=1 Tax=Labrys wisconsinensis TaxID=425677 RepID=A0ABU0JKU6_9HYPH|nr:alpha/beta hydrolase [Labrys wisconsinensis]MDQ0474013.1 pimeloyl-ACP methyl ester carboxylesterase [Labrys wisconsinensis]
MAIEIRDHAGRPAVHGRAAVNGVRLHYVTAGSGPPLLLLHGVPKTASYWYRLIPLLTPHVTVVAPDIRGFGESEKPAAGYDMATVAQDLAQLMTALGHDTFCVAGEDWGAAFAYALAASERRRVKKLSFGEMLLPGFGIELWSFLNEENVASIHWSWHVNFFFLRDVPEMLIQGREAIFWSTWMKNETFNPAALSDEAVDEWVRSASGPGGLRGIFAVYRAHFENIRLTREWAKEKLDIPVLAIGSDYFMKDEPRRQIGNVASHVDYVEIERCGHSMALEQPEALAEAMLRFLR